MQLIFNNMAKKKKLKTKVEHSSSLQPEDELLVPLDFKIDFSKPLAQKKKINIKIVNNKKKKKKNGSNRRKLF